MSSLPRACLGCGRKIASGSKCERCGGTTRRGYGWTWQQVAALVLARDDRTCRYCGGEATTVDHVVPLARGGTSRPSNLVAACRPCNSAKKAEAW